ncbi:NIPSNAP family protein [Sphingomonas naphthae]|uniref:NIPSNAP family protein n=1 Tax=Sphingomonas naphthae TaxID=1813468 RepID=A0ABY7TQ59_9SPHN|nr:NIPSNAP family protein [Sphingomonas naphthae]WCT73989.1 NIPSNAP family protein [Sphingomonas naphthae]
MELFVHATLKIRIGAYDRFAAAMAKQVPVLESHGWKLLGAYVTAVGPICTVVDLWQIPDANAYFEATAKWRADPDFMSFREVGSEVIVAEMVTMVTKTSYSP